MASTIDRDDVMFEAGDYSVVRNPDWTEEMADQEYRWLVLDADADCVNEYDDLGHAIVDAKDCAETAEAEARDVRLEELRDELTNAAGDCEDEDLLRRALAMLRGE